MSIFEKKPQPYDLSNFTVLIVEDSLYMQSLMTSMLKAFGVGDILACENAKDAVELLTVLQSSKKSRLLKNVDIILTDWLMPKGSGGDLIKWVRSHEKDSIRFLPIIVVSGYTTTYVTSMARDLGANDTLVKPVSGTALASRICSVIDNPRSFIRTRDFFGPDRRRHDVAFKGKDRRNPVLNEVTIKETNIE
jgi:two-component system chemotaxis response regulator CheY